MKKIICCILSSAIASMSFAQKLPAVQASSISAPVSVKVDGQAGEWGDLQAFNKSTGIFYTMANDARNLYLVVQSTDYVIIEKIVMGGITLTIDGDGKTKSEGGMAVTYPAYYTGEKFPQLNLAKREPTEAYISSKNNQLKDQLKSVKVTGVKMLKDSILSIYNEEGFKVASSIDEDLKYTVEFAIPLTYIRRTLINYNIRVNGASQLGKVQIMDTARGKRASYIGADGITYALDGNPAETLVRTLPNDFRGQYILAK